MTNFHTDNLPELTAGNYHKTANNHTVTCTSTEPHSQAEPGINMVKKHSQRAITHPWGSVGLCPFLAGQKLVSSSGVDLRDERQSLPSGIENVPKTYLATCPISRTFSTSISISPSITWSKSWPIQRIVSFWAVGSIRRTTLVRRSATGA